MTSGIRKPAPVQPPPPQRHHTYTVWCTRDSNTSTGELSNLVRVWLAKPSRIAAGLGAFWNAPAFENDLYAEWALDQCVKNARTYPDDDRQCICVEGDSVRAPGDLLDGTS